ncbi:MAG: beta-ketoacyl-[acyl-carrier-protein] synthase family protein [Deltaproteobacteria bacterium]|nr:beta-ketoacyl-[acyl-carrier-protein] synthase family protein [Deltaproteobacteria bacterium]MCL5277991.1 beta-ketoacyl-[acyl-carrier-protein] synthase family protein [Deltaproteobacteria bacterium]
MQMVRPVILGYDSVSPLGTVFEEQWGRAVQGQSGIGPLTRFPLRENFPVQVAGQVADVDIAPYPFLRPREMVHWKSPVFRYGMLVVHRALQKIGLDVSEAVSPRTATTFSTAIGGLDAVLDADRTMVQSGQLPKPYVNPNSCINMVGGKVSILANATGPIVTTVTACATGSTSMIIGALLLQSRMADVAICGAVDFPLVESIVAGFATMNGAYQDGSQPAPEAPARASRPFSVDRRGFIISEGAGCIILSTKEFAEAHGLGYSIELSGWSMTADAYHSVVPRQDTIVQCIDNALRLAGIRPREISAINAHATSTRVGDEVEYKALQQVFQDNIPPVSANKSMIGHAMGASSALESILAMEGMMRDTILPTINYTPDPAISIDCVPGSARTLRQEYVLKNAFGFGGANACTIFHRVR